MKVAILPNLYDVEADDVIRQNGDFIRETAILELAKIPSISVIDAAWSDQQTLSKNAAIAIRFRYHLLGDALIIRCKAIVPESGEVAWLSELRPVEFAWPEISIKLIRIIHDHLNVVAPRSTELETDAYKALVQARYHYNKFNPEDGVQALKLYKEAVRIAPQSAEAHAGLAKIYFYMGNWVIMSPDEAYPQVMHHAQKALELSPGFGDALVQLAHVQMYFEKDFVAAGKNFRKAIEGHAISANVWEKYTWYLCANGRYDEAVTAIEKASALEPSNLFIKHFIGDVLRYKGDIEASTKAFHAVLEQEPTFRHSIEYIAGNYILQGKLDQASRYYHRYRALVPNPEKGLIPLALLQAAKQQWNDVDEIARKLESQLKGNRDRSLVNRLIIASIKEDNDKLERIFKETWRKGIGIIALMCDPLFENLRTQAFYKDAMKKVRFSAENHFIGFAEEEVKAVEIGQSKDSVRMTKSDFLFAESEGNYVTVHYFEKFSLKKRLLRTTINDLVNRLADDHIVRCHRSFAVNLLHNHSIRGNAKSRILIFADYNFKIPVSRNFQLEEKLKNDPSTNA